MLLVLDLHLVPAEGLQRGDGGDGGVGPLPADGRDGLDKRPQDRLLVLADPVPEDEPAAALAVHVGGDDDDAAAERHVLGHAVVHADGLEGEREAGRHERVALLEDARRRRRRRRRPCRRAGQRLLDRADRLDPVRHRGGDQARVLPHQVRGREAEDRVHEVLVLLVPRRLLASCLSFLFSVALLRGDGYGGRQVGR